MPEPRHGRPRDLDAHPAPGAFTRRDDGNGHPGGFREYQNGLPEPAPYTWRAGEAQRDAEVAARVAAIQAQARERGGDG
jgi:hypothetical protein